jgi:hypothetical protein
MATRPNYLSASFRDLESAEKAYKILRDRGYHDNEISVVMSEESMKKYFDKDPKKEESDFGNKAAEGAGVGAGIGGAIGAAAGIILALGTAVVVPGLGIVVAGPLAAGLAGAGGGGIAGGIIGALVGAGIPKETADKYEQGVKDGEIVVAVQLRNEDDGRYFEDEWRRHNVYPEGKTFKTRSESKARTSASKSGTTKQTAQSKSGTTKRQTAQSGTTKRQTAQSKSGTTKRQTQSRNR